MPLAAFDAASFASFWAANCERGGGGRGGGGGSHGGGVGGRINFQSTPRGGEELQPLPHKNAWSMRCRGEASSASFWLANCSIQQQHNTYILVRTTWPPTIQPHIQGKAFKALYLLPGNTSTLKY
jgi:hypothetical protein